MATVLKGEVVNDVVVLNYSSGEYAQYLAAYKEYEDFISPVSEDLSEMPDPPKIENALEGLRILDVSVNEQSNITRSPIESGANISDSKIRMPRKITIKGICDNMRGPIVTTKDTRSSFDSGIPLIGGAINSVVNGVVDTIMGYEFETEQEILTVARSVYAKIHKMYTDKSMPNGRPKTWIISTKGAVYDNMILQSVEQLNDAEHLMVIPVTLHFEELMMVGEDQTDGVYLDELTSPIKMSGYRKQGNLLDRTLDWFKENFS